MASSRQSVGTLPFPLSVPSNVTLTWQPCSRTSILAALEEQLPTGCGSDALRDGNGGVSHGTLGAGHSLARQGMTG